MSEAEIARRVDQEHLRILSILHYISGALQLFGGFTGLMFIVIGGVIASGSLPANNPNDRMAMQIMGTMFSVIGLIAFAVSLLTGGAIIYAGRCLARYERHTYCLVVAAIESLWFPLGTALGVFTIIVLLRDSVKELFERTAERS